MVEKRVLNNLQEWQDWRDWISRRFGIENIVNGDTATPIKYPCVVSWYEYEDNDFYRTDNDVCAYNFIYLSDFVSE